MSNQNSRLEGVLARYRAAVSEAQLNQQKQSRRADSLVNTVRQKIEDWYARSATKLREVNVSLQIEGEFGPNGPGTGSKVIIAAINNQFRVSSIPKLKLTLNDSGIVEVVLPTPRDTVYLDSLNFSADNLPSDEDIDLILTLYIEAILLP